MKKKNKIWIYLVLSTGIILLIINSCKKDSELLNTVTDIDGNIYHTVKIGTQVWMVENLKTNSFRNGDPIPNVQDSSTWINLTTAAYCNYNNDTSISKVYGKLYNWYAVTDSRNIAPIGWHVPNDTDWKVLVTYLGGYSSAIGKLKEQDTTHWQSPNSGATNESGFTALPGGCRSGHYGYFASYGYVGYYWCPTENDTESSYFVLNYNDFPFIVFIFNKNNGLSVRCLKD